MIGFLVAQSLHQRVVTEMFDQLVRRILLVGRKSSCRHEMKFKSCHSIYVDIYTVYIHIIIYTVYIYYIYVHNSVSVGNLQAPKIQTVFWKRNFPAPQSVGAGLLIVLSLTSVVSPSGLAARSVQRWGSQGAHGAKGPLESQDVLP